MKIAPRLFSILFFCYLSITIGALAEEIHPRPNIVILYADDFGYGDLGVQNPDSKIPTPNLDRLAASGMRFIDAHSSSGICTPSRYALLTGRYHWRKFHGIVGSFGRSSFDAKRVTLPELLQSEGYRTACIGKWHLGWDWNAIRHTDANSLQAMKKANNFPAEAFDWSKSIPNGPLDHGFDYYFGDDVPNFPPYTWIENDKVLQVPTVEVDPQPKTAEGHWEARPGPSVEGWRLDRVMPRLTERCVDWIAEQEGAKKPFFLYFPWTAPHAPIVPTEEFKDTSKAGGYGDFVSQCDATTGQVLEALERHGFKDNTIVIFTSDNGPEHYAYPRVNNTGHYSMGHLRGLKRDVWEGGHRVPMIIRWPGQISAGEVSDALIGQIDIYTTLASIIKSEIPEGMAEDSLDQTQVLCGGDAVRNVLVHNTYKDTFAIRKGDFVLIEGKLPGRNQRKVPENYVGLDDYADIENSKSLYNLRVDLGQRNNIIDSHSKMVADMSEKLATIRQRNN